MGGLVTQIEDLQIKVSNLEEANKKLGKDVLDLTFNNILSDQSTAFLTAGSDGYSLLRADFGLVAVKIEDIKAYASGTRVELSIGNLSDATVVGLNATVDWGAMDAKGLPNFDAVKSKSTSWAESLKPGSWNKVSVTLEGTPPSELGYIRLKEAGHRSISLRMAR